MSNKDGGWYQKMTKVEERDKEYFKKKKKTKVLGLGGVQSWIEDLEQGP